LQEACQGDGRRGKGREYVFGKTGSYKNFREVENEEEERDEVTRELTVKMEGNLIKECRS
jgi:hypothetical protein